MKGGGGETGGRRGVEGGLGGVEREKEAEEKLKGGEVREGGEWDAEGKMKGGVRWEKVAKGTHKNVEGG